MDNVKLLQETLDIMQTGSYQVGGVCRRLKLQPETFRRAIYLSAEQVSVVKPKPLGGSAGVPDRPCNCSVANEDSFSAAREMIVRCGLGNGFQPSCDWLQIASGRVLVLNFANPVNPGGGVRFGAKAQEEDLCRKSTLLVSLESPEAAPFYTTHQAAGSLLSSNAMILSPDVEIIRDQNNAFLADSQVVSVLTCAAPIVIVGNRPAKDILDRLLYDRIMGILHVAAAYHYHYLVLGAWGCGAFGNDAKQVAESFYCALRDFCRENDTYASYFRDIVFAVLDRNNSQYNFRCFEEQFRHFKERES